MNKKLVIPDCLKEKMKMEIEREEKSTGVKEIITMNDKERKIFEKQIEKLKNEIEKKDKEIKRIKEEKEEREKEIKRIEKEKEKEKKEIEEEIKRIKEEKDEEIRKLREENKKETSLQHKPKFGDIIKDYGFAEDQNLEYKSTIKVLVFIIFSFEHTYIRIVISFVKNLVIFQTLLLPVFLMVMAVIKL
jgi:seryl-tRNA synthetase